MAGRTKRGFDNYFCSGAGLRGRGARTQAEGTGKLFDFVPGHSRAEGVASSLHQLGILSQATGDLSEARRLYAESLKIARDLGDKSGVAISLAQTALLQETEGNLEQALDLIRQAEALFVEPESPMAERARRNRERLEKKIANEQMSEQNETFPRRPGADE